LRGSTLIADRRVIGQQNVKKPSVELQAKPAKIWSTLVKIGLIAVSRTAVELKLDQESN
jgi:hypothetical protein